MSKAKYWAVAVLAAAGLAIGGAFAAIPAGATTSTCTNIAHPVAAPIGCGGIYLPLMGTGTQPNSTSLTLTAASQTFNAKVVIDPYDTSNTLQDWTVFTVAGAHNPIDGNAEYVAMLTPNGQFAGAGANDSANLCLSVDKVRRTVNHHRVWRWVTLLRSCQAGGGANFTPGHPDTTAGGVAGTVSSANPWQVWSPIASGTNGYVLAEDFLSQNFHNTPYVLDDSGFGGAGTQQIAYPEKDPTDSKNQVWKVIGCTNPVTSLTPGFYNCP